MKVAQNYSGIRWKGEKRSLDDTQKVGLKGVPK